MRLPVGYEAHEPGERPSAFSLFLPSSLCSPGSRTAAGNPAYGVRSDAWQRYPACTDWLMDLIFDDASSDLVLLGRRLPRLCRLRNHSDNPMSPGRQQIKCRCIATFGHLLPVRICEHGARGSPVQTRRAPAPRTRGRRRWTRVETGFRLHAHQRVCRRTSRRERHFGQRKSGDTKPTMKHAGDLDQTVDRNLKSEGRDPRDPRRTLGRFLRELPRSPVLPTAPPARCHLCTAAAHEGQAASMILRITRTADNKPDP